MTDPKDDANSIQKAVAELAKREQAEADKGES